MVYILGEAAPGSIDAIGIMFVLAIIVKIILIICPIVLPLIIIKKLINIKIKKIEAENSTYDEATEMLRKREEEMKNNNNHEN